MKFFILYLKEIIKFENVRPVIHDAAFDELCASIKKFGVLEPVIVKKFNGGYALVAGFRRVEAVRTIGYDNVTAGLIDIKDSEVFDVQIHENDKRVDVPKVDLAVAIKKRNGEDRRKSTSNSRSPGKE